MPSLTADVIGMNKHHRTFLQFGGPRPGNPAKYAGQDAQYVSITGVSNPESGGVDPVRVHDPSRIGKYRLVGRTTSAPDLPGATFTFYEKHGGIPRQLLSGCKLNAYEVVGNCADLSDLMRGWSDYVLVYEEAEFTDKDLGDRTPFDADEAIEDGLTAVLAAIYPVGALSFGEGGASEVSREVVDICYMPGDTCTDGCDWGYRRIYAVATTSGAGSPGLPTEVIYSLDGGATWRQTNVDGMTATEAALAIDVAGRYLIVIGSAAYYFAEINAKTGVPGAFTKVTTGFVANRAPTDLYVASASAVFFCGQGGYLYKASDVTAGVSVLNAGVATTQNLSRIRGNGETLVATGAAGVVVKSVNKGVTWSQVTTNPEAGAVVQAVEVLDENRYWIGTSTGNVYYTLNGGETWTAKEMPGSTAGAVYDIVFPTQSVGYVSWSDASPTARLYTTFDGGEDWGYGAQRVLNWPVFDKGGRIACPATDDPGWAANYVAIAGLAGDAIDGIIVMGAANIL